MVMVKRLTRTRTAMVLILKGLWNGWKKIMPMKLLRTPPQNMSTPGMANGMMKVPSLQGRRSIRLYSIPPYVSMKLPLSMKMILL